MPQPWQGGSSSHYPKGKEGNFDQRSSRHQMHGCFSSRSFLSRMNSHSSMRRSVSPSAQPSSSHRIPPPDVAGLQAKSCFLCCHILRLPGQTALLECKAEITLLLLKLLSHFAQSFPKPEMYFKTFKELPLIQGRENPPHC